MRKLSLILVVLIAFSTFIAVRAFAADDLVEETLVETTCPMHQNQDGKPIQARRGLGSMMNGMHRRMRNQEQREPNENCSCTVQDETDND